MPRYLISLIAIGVFASAFVYMHSGPRAENLCAGKGFSGTGAFSLWPPGARCTGGEPAIEQVAFDPIFILPAVAILLLISGALALRQSGAAGR